MFVKNLSMLLILTCSLAAQLPPLPAQSYYEIGSPDWVTPCGDYMPHASMTSTPWNRTIDPSYPGTVNKWSVNVGGIFYLRAEQHDVCPAWMAPGAGLAPYFLFSPRTGVFSSLAAIPNFQLGQSTIFNTHPTAVLYNAQFQGPNELDPNIQTWAYQINVPNNPALVGQEWAVQILALTSATMTFNLGDSHYTKII